MDFEWSGIPARKRDGEPTTSFKVSSRCSINTRGTKHSGNSSFPSAQSCVLHAFEKQTSSHRPVAPPPPHPGDPDTPLRPPGWADTHDLMTTRAAGLDLGTGDHHRDGAGVRKPSAKCSVKVPREETLGPGQFWGFWLCLVQELARQQCWGLGEGGRVLEPPTQALVPVPCTVSSGELPRAQHPHRWRGQQTGRAAMRGVTVRPSSRGPSPHCAVLHQARARPHSAQRGGISLQMGRRGWA